MAEEARPGAATGAAIIEVIFGGLGSIFGLIGLGVGILALGSGIPGIFIFLATLIGLAVGVFGLLSGIFLLMNKKMGVSFAPIWIWGTIAAFAIGVIGSILAATLVTSASSGILGAAAADLKAAGADMKDVANLGAASSALGIGAAILGAVWGLIWQVAPAIIVLILLGMKPVKDFYAKAA